MSASASVTAITPKGLPRAIGGSRMLKRLVSHSRTTSKKNRVSPGQQRLPWAWDIRLNQIPDEWHQVAVRIRKANGILDGDKERSIWSLLWGDRFIGRDKNTGVSGATPDYHPGEEEATLYLRNSGSATEGRGLYLAHRGIFNNADTYDEWLTDTPKLQAEVFVGLSGRATAASNGQLTINLPTLTANPRIIATTESNGYVQVTNSLTSDTLTARDAAGNAINGAVINYIVVYNSSSNAGGLNSHY